MRTRKYTLRFGAAALACAALALAGSPALAAEYWLRAAATTVDMPNPAGGAAISVPMWGYAKCPDGTGVGCGPVTVPGPALTVPPADSALTVHLLNALSVPTSLVINGLIKPMTPVWDNDATGPRPSLSARVRSFDAEAAPNGSADYAWPNVRPGTYLYQSGTQPQVQVQMGLYGALTRNVADAVAATGTAAAIPGQAYPGTGYAFDNEATLLYSEIDPALHAAVADGSYGTTGPTSTFNYAPKYFLINGKVYPDPALQSVNPAGAPGTTLLRLLNAGLTTHVPMILGKYWDVLAEDGKPYPYRRNQYTALLPAAKALDVLISALDGAGPYAIMDRRLSLSNNGVSGGGMMAYLRVGQPAGGGFGGGGGGGGGAGTGNVAPVAADDPRTADVAAYRTVRGVALSIAAPGVLVNDTDANVGQALTAVAAAGTTSASGSYVLNANGSFTYTPPNAAGGDTFTYQAGDPHGALSNFATVAINVVEPIAPALAPSPLDNFDQASTVLDTVNWAYSSDATNYIGTNGSTAIANGTGGQAIWNTVAFGASQYAAFTGTTALAGSSLILKATGGTLPQQPDSYVGVSHDGANVVISTSTSCATSCSATTQATFATATSSGTLSAAVDANGLVTVFIGGSFVGGVQLPNLALWKSGGGKVGIKLGSGAAVDDFQAGDLP